MRMRLTGVSAVSAVLPIVCTVIYLCCNVTVLQCYLLHVIYLLPSLGKCGQRLHAAHPKLAFSHDLQPKGV